MRNIAGELCKPYEVELSYTLILGWFYSPSPNCGYSIPLKYPHLTLAALARCKHGGNYIFHATMEEIMIEAEYRKKINDQMIIQSRERITV